LPGSALFIKHGVKLENVKDNAKGMSEFNLAESEKPSCDGDGDGEVAMGGMCDWGGSTIANCSRYMQRDLLPTLIANCQLLAQS